MSKHRARSQRPGFPRIAVAIVLLAGIAAVMLDDDSATGGSVVAPAEAAGWKGELGLFNFSVKGDDGRSRQALLKGDPKGDRMAGTVARQSIFWSCIQPKEGPWTLDKCRQALVIDRLADAGWKVQVVLRTKHGDFGPAPFWATDPGREKADPAVSYAPRDMQSSASPEYGYSESYYAFVRRVIQRYCKGGDCRIHSLVIENEANASDKWRGRGGDPASDVADYVRLVATARKAVDDSGARLPLYDSGLQGFGILWNVLAEEKARGNAAVEAKYEKLFNARKPASTIDKELAKRSKNPSTTKIRMLLESDLHRYTDGINFHHYQTPESIPEVTAYLRRYVPSGHELITNEVGIKESIIQSAEPDLVGAWLIQKLVYLFDARVSPVVWFSVQSSGNVGGLATGKAAFKPKIANAYNAFASRVGDGVTDVSLTTVDAGGRPVVRALLGGAEGRFAVEWFQDGGQGDWGDVTAPDGCDAAGNPYSTRYLRLMDCR